MLEKTGYRYDTDIWSVGVLLYIMVYGKPPFYGKDKEEITKKIKKMKYKFPKSSDVSSEAIDLIK